MEKVWLKMAISIEVLSWFIKLDREIFRTFPVSSFWSGFSKYLYLNTFYRICYHVHKMWLKWSQLAISITKDVFCFILEFSVASVFVFVFLIQLSVFTQFLKRGLLLGFEILNKGWITIPFWVKNFAVLKATCKWIAIVDLDSK